MTEASSDVFISYSTRNKIVAKRIASALEPEIRCWFAPRDIPPGADWAGTIDEAIEAHRIFLVVLTEEGNASKEIAKEVALANSRHSEILALRVGEYELSSGLSYHLSTTQWLTFPSVDAVDREAIRAAVANILDRPVQPRKLSRGLRRSRVVRAATWAVAFVMLGLGILAGVQLLSEDEGPPLAALEIVSSDLPPVVEAGSTARIAVIIENEADTPVDAVKLLLSLPDHMRSLEGSRLASSDPVKIEGLSRHELTVEVQIQAPGSAEATVEVYQRGRLTPGSRREWRPRVLAPVLSFEVDPVDLVLGVDGRFAVSVSNSGDAPAHGVTLSAELPEGLETPAGPGPLEHDVGDVGAGASQSIEVPFHAALAGDYVVSFSLRSTNAADIQSECELRVLQARVSVSVEGPSRVFIGRPISLTVTLVNAGEVPVQRAFARLHVPSELRPLQLGSGSMQPNGTWEAVLAALEPGRKQVFETTWQGAGLGRSRFRAVAGGRYCEAITREHDVAIEGVSVILLEIVDIEDPVQIGETITYVVTATNQGSAPEKGAVLDVTLPIGLGYRSAVPPPTESGGAELRFEIGDIDPKARREVRVTVEAQQTGIAELEAALQGPSGRYEQVEHTAIGTTSAARVELVALEDPVEVGGDVTYLVSFTNQGVDILKDIQCRLILSRLLEYRSGEGATEITADGRSVTFSIPSLPAKSMASFQIRARAVSDGVAVSKLSYRTPMLKTALNRVVSTRLYR